MTKPSSTTQVPAAQDATSPGRDRGSLLDLLREQRSLYERVLSLASQQAAVIERGDAESLLRILAERKQHISELADLNGLLLPFTSDWEACAASLSESDRAEVASLTKAIGELRQAIASTDEADAGALSASRERIGKQLQGMSLAGQAKAAYRQAPAATPAGYQGIGVGSKSDAGRFTDQQG